MKNATEKQINLLQKLNVKFNENITIKEASILIAKTLKAQRQNNNNDIITDSNDVVFTAEYVKQLLNKYNAFYTTGNNGNYNNDKGSNYQSELLNDSRKFKSYIRSVLKKELPGDLFDIRCSFAGWNDDIIITLKAPSEKLFKNYYDIRADYNNHFSGFDVMRYYNLNANFNYCNYSDFGSLEPSTEKRIYNEYVKNQTLQFNKDNFTKYILTDEYTNKLAFIYNLLLSYSYDFSDIQTDYFNSGLDITIYFEAIEKDENKAEAFKDKFYYLKAANQLELLKYYPLEENEENELKAAFEEYKKESDRVMEEYRKQEAQRKAEAEAYNKRIAAENEIINDSVEYYEIAVQNIYNCNFSNWNKPCNIDEAKEYCEEHPEAFGGTIANIHEVINFTNEKALNYFNNNLLENREFLKDVNCGCSHIDLNTMELLDYKKCYGMTDEERILNNIGWMRGCIIIALNNKPMYLVDTEGSCYCRYVGFLPNSYNIDLTPVQKTIQ